MKLGGLVLVGVSALSVACSTLLDADFDRPHREELDASADVHAEDVVVATEASASESGVDASVPRPTCGDMRGYDPQSSWPIAGGCPTRPGHASIVPPVKPHIQWRYVLPQNKDAYFMSAPVVRGDGLTLATAVLSITTAVFDAVVVGVRDGVEQFRTPISSDPLGTDTVPTIAADGSFYVQTWGSLHHFSAAGVKLWSVPLDSGGGSPAILGDGSVIALGRYEMVAFAPDTGARTWTYAIGAGPPSQFFGSVAVSASNTIYALSDVPAKIHAVVGGTAVWTADLETQPELAPAVTDTGDIVVKTFGALRVFTSQGKLSFALPFHTSDGNRVARAGSYVWFTGHLDGPFRLDLDTKQQFSPEAEGRFSELMTLADGSVVFNRFGGSAEMPMIFGCLAPSGTLRWAVELDVGTSDMYGAAVAPDGTFRVAYHRSLYAIGD